MVDYDENAPYEVGVAEKVMYEDGVTSHHIWFFAHADFYDRSPPTYNLDAPVTYYFNYYKDKKVQIPLSNKVSANGQTVYAIKGTKEVLEAIQSQKTRDKVRMTI